jgi:hypothetical protein
MSGLRVMVPAPSWAERPEVARYRREVRLRLEREEAARRAALRAAPVVAARQEPDDRFAQCPPSIWGEPRLPQPWRPEQPAALSPGDYAPIPASPWDQLRRVEQAPGSRTEPAPDPVPRRVAPDLGYAPIPKSPWDR